MPIAVSERHAARRTGEDFAERVFIITGTDDDDAARAAASNAAPATLGTLQREGTEVEEVADGLLYATVRWAKDNGGGGGSDGEQTFSFETRGGQQRILQSLETVNGYAPPDTPMADFGGAIGVTENGIDGADIHVPVFTFSLTLYMDALSSSYVQTLYEATACVNSGTFSVTIESGVTLDFAAGEVLFLGAAGTRRGDNPWELQLAFAASPNITGLTLGGITGIAKDGWDYLWCRYQETEDTTAKVLVRKPIAAYVERVYRRANLAALNP